MRARATLAGGAAAAVLALGGCVTPAPNAGAYVENGKGALDSAISATASAHLAVQQRLDGDASRPFADVVVTESESAMAPIESSFGGVDPPSPAEDALRDAVTKALGDATDALASARIAIRRDDSQELQRAADDLGTAQSQLQSLRDGLS
jgi:hypothetical protein